MAEIGRVLSELSGLLFILLVILAMSVAAGIVARKVKGRRFATWFAISAVTQAVAITLPTLFLILFGIIDPANWFGEAKAVTFESFRLLAEMSVVAGTATLIVIAFLEQTRWKSCPACKEEISWVALHCPHCAADQSATATKKQKKRPGSYPHFASRTIHLPVELDRDLKEMAKPLQSANGLTEQAAVSQLVRDVLLRTRDALGAPDPEEETDLPAPATATAPEHIHS